MSIVSRILAVCSVWAVWTVSAIAQDVPLIALGRFEGWRDNPLIGYGIVVGLSGSGDSPRSGVTRQALQNVYNRLGVTVSDQDISSRNVAVVVVMATLPPSANIGDRISVTVSSTGDARSLAGGTLLMVPLLGPNGRPYALAQGSLIAGGYHFEAEADRQQQNYPTTARIENGATVEAAVNSVLLNAEGYLTFYLNEPQFSTASRISEGINNAYGYPLARAVNADEVRINYSGSPDQLTRFIADLLELRITPATSPRIVINERTGTIVAGADVRISSVVISQGDIRITIDATNTASQPLFFSGVGTDISSLVITNTDLRVQSSENDVVATFDNTTVADLVQGLSQAQVDTRRIISILQAIKSAGALHAEIIVQ
ncbi:flagellar basal body P-ring protein FlgI [Woodsholea maritima]|uniref:flagellar basal body P-ring protein FlgI n=1 Tax=Woodsholea maritima TaxID=240237 RepID=UPI0003A7C2C6|nr:flagellar basal body P-ring protein FlgI [Woodsholea maritima]